MMLNHFQQSTANPLDLSELWHARDLQVIDIENIAQYEIIVRRALEKTLTPREQFRLVRDGEQRLIALTLDGDMSLKAVSLAKQARIENGELVPLHLDFALRYDAHLELQTGVIHELEVGPHSSARFNVTSEGLRGAIVRGYTFQLYSVMEGGALK